MFKMSPCGYPKAQLELPMRQLGEGMVAGWTHQIGAFQTMKH